MERRLTQFLSPFLFSFLILQYFEGVSGELLSSKEFHYIYLYFSFVSIQQKAFKSNYWSKGYTYVLNFSLNYMNNISFAQTVFLFDPIQIQLAAGMENTGMSHPTPTRNWENCCRNLILFSRAIFFATIFQK